MTCFSTDFFSGQEVLITGGAGFLGSHLAESLIAIGAKVTAVDYHCREHLVNLQNCLGQLEYIQDDILNDTFQTLLTERPFDSIFHLAGNSYVPSSVEQPWCDFQTNAMGTLKLLDSLRKIGSSTRVVFLSSAAVYGNIDSSSIGEDNPTVPISPYGVSKLAAERYVAVYARLYGLRAATLRPFSAYGPRQQKQVVYDFISKLSRHSTEIQASGDGTQVRDFTYVDDVVQAALSVAQKSPLCGEAYNVASGVACSTQELLSLLCELMEIRPQIRWNGKNRPGDPQRFLANIDRLQGLGWRPTVSFREGLRRTVNWYRRTDTHLAGSDAVKRA